MHIHNFARLLACGALAVLVAGQLFAAQQSKSANIAGMTLHYKVVLPDGYDPAKAYPAILAFPGGPQTLPMVDSLIARNFGVQAQKRGYIVIAASAPDGKLFFQGGDRVFPEFLDQLLRDYKIRDNKFHIAGISNGGISAFHLAASHPKYFWSVTGFPGYLPDATPARVGALSKMCINMFVGEQDSGWVEDMRAQSEDFRKKGLSARFTIEKGQGHVMSTLQGDGSARLFDLFEEARQGCGK
jgi:poly(3-hydroxybutyrate) depolymerase